MDSKFSGRLEDIGPGLRALSGSEFNIQCRLNEVEPVLAASMSFRRNYAKKAIFTDVDLIMLFNNPMKISARYIHQLPLCESFSYYSFYHLLDETASGDRLLVVCLSMFVMCSFVSDTSLKKKVKQIKVFYGMRSKWHHGVCWAGGVEWVSIRLQTGYLPTCI